MEILGIRPRTVISRAVCGELLPRAHLSHRGRGYTGPVPGAFLGAPPHQRAFGF